MHHIYPVKEGTLMKFKHTHAAFTDRIFSIKSLTRNLTRKTRNHSFNRPRCNFVTSRELDVYYPLRI